MSVKSDFSLGDAATLTLALLTPPKSDDASTVMGAVSCLGAGVGSGAGSGSFFGAGAGLDAGAGVGGSEVLAAAGRGSGLGDACFGSGAGLASGFGDAGFGAGVCFIGSVFAGASVLAGTCFGF